MFANISIAEFDPESRKQSQMKMLAKKRTSN
jgi:hypothetical protein